MTISPIIPIWIMAIICIALTIIAIKNKHNLIIQIIIIVLLFIINLRLMITSENVKTVANNLDVLFVIDNTISMVAEDYQGQTPRLTAVKKDCEYIMDKLGGSRYSIITFSNYSQIVAPYTRDSNMIAEAIETIRVPSEYYASGSSLNTGLEDMIKILKSSRQKQNRKSIIFFISDGEITNDESLKSFAECKAYIDEGAVLGYGTSMRRLYESRKL